VRHGGVLVAGAILLLSGCAVPTVNAVPTAAPATTTAQASTTGADCLAPQVLTALGFDRDERSRAGVHPDAPEAVPVPADFAPVLAVECSTGETMTDSAGEWAAVTTTRREGDLAALLAALATDQSASPAVTCAPGGQRAELWLLDTMGDAVRVAVPGSMCGRLPSPVREALDGLDAVDVEHAPVHLVAPRETAG